MIKKFFITTSFLFIIFFLSRDRTVYTYTTQNTSTNFVRVAVIKDASEVFLRIKGSYKIFTLNTNEFLKEGRFLEETVIKPTMSGLAIGSSTFKIYGIKIVPKNDSTIYVDKRRFRGNIDIVRTENMKLLVVNHIDVEDYLRGVLYHEVSHWWPMEALKAQAIAARTYALYQAQTMAGKDYDLTSDVYSQVYGGRISERWRTDLAVNATSNKVVTYNGKIYPTYYHATCGGRTEDASNLWNIDIEPLDGVKCSFCTISPHYRWKKELGFSEIESKLKEAGFKIGKIASIRTVGKFPSARVKEVEIKSDMATLLISAKDFRNALGNNSIRSTNFEIIVKKQSICFNGYGWGHGVGLCQWGAYAMAKKHFKAIEILNFYYPGSSIENYR